MAKCLDHEDTKAREKHEARRTRRAYSGGDPLRASRSSSTSRLRDPNTPTRSGIHALGDGVGAAFSDKYGGRAPEEIVCDTLYRFSQGMKVAVECTLMAADAGLLDMSQEVIAIAGTDSGADTAIVCKPTYPRTFHALEIHEVLAKPRIP